MERTGVLQIDRVIDEWVAADPMFEELGCDGNDCDDPDCEFYEPWYGPLSQMRDPVIADGFCTQVTCELAEFMVERGLNAVSSEELDNRVDGHPFSGIRVHSPEAFGYHDKTRDNGFPTHAAVIVFAAEGTFMVDFTAAQYGITDTFPVVQRFSQGAWERSW